MSEYPLSEYTIEATYARNAAFEAFERAQTLPPGAARDLVTHALAAACAALSDVSAQGEIWSGDMIRHDLSSALRRLDDVRR